MSHRKYMTRVRTHTNQGPGVEAHDPGSGTYTLRANVVQVTADSVAQMKLMRWTGKKRSITRVHRR